MKRTSIIDCIFRYSYKVPQVSCYLLTLTEIIKAAQPSLTTRAKLEQGLVKLRAWAELTAVLYVYKYRGVSTG